MSVLGNTIKLCESFKNQLEQATGSDLKVTILIDGVPVPMVEHGKTVDSPRGTFKAFGFNEDGESLHVKFYSKFFTPTHKD